MYVLGIALAVTVVDQLTKYAIHQAMVLHESIPVIPGFFHITYILNRGAAFGILENQQWLFLVMALALFLLYGLFRKKLPATPWVYGGAFGRCPGQCPGSDAPRGGNRFLRFSHLARIQRCRYRYRRRRRTFVMV